MKGKEKRKTYNTAFQAVGNKIWEDITDIRVNIDLYSTENAVEIIISSPSEMVNL